MNRKKVTVTILQKWAEEPKVFHKVDYTETVEGVFYIYHESKCHAYPLGMLVEIVYEDDKVDYNGEEKECKKCRYCKHLITDKVTVSDSGKVRGRGHCYNHPRRAYTDQKLVCDFSRQACKNFERVKED